MRLSEVRPRNRAYGMGKSRAIKKLGGAICSL